MLVNATPPTSPAPVRLAQTPPAAPTVGAKVKKPAHADSMAFSRPTAPARIGIVKLAPGQDGLAITAQAGDSVSTLARHWGAPDQADAASAAIQKANGLTSDTLAVGQALRIPYEADSAGLALLIAVALQKDLAARSKAGHGLAALDLAGVVVNPGPLDSYLVTAPRKDGQGLQHFAICDDMSDDSGLTWSVQPIDKKEYDKRAGGQI